MQAELVSKRYQIHNISEYYNHPHTLAGRVVTSDWFVKSFIIVVYDTIFLKFNQNFLSESRLKIVLKDNNYKTIPRPVKSDCSSCGLPIFVSMLVKVQSSSWIS